MNTKIQELSFEFRACKNEVTRLKEELKKAEEEWDSVEQRLLFEMVEEGVNSVSFEGLGRLSMVTKNHLSVTAANKPEFFKYLRESGNGGLLKEDVNAMTLTAFLKTHLEEMIAKNQAELGMDIVEARRCALDMLNGRGASYFSKKTVTFKGE